MTPQQLSQDASAGGPLAGFRVVDFTENMAGPFGTMILGDQGADVIKVESPEGDIIRTTGTGTGGMSGYFANLNRSKRSIAIDLRSTDSGRVLSRLVDSADVVVHSFRPQAAARLGIDAATLTANRPTLVHAAIVGFGESGPYAGRPVYDHVIQALSGMAALQAGESSEPSLIRHGIVDKTTGHVLAQSICAALLRRSRTRRGESFTVSMLDAALAFFWPDGMMDHTITDPAERRATVASMMKLTPTKDGHLAMMVLKDNQWKGLVAALDLHHVDPTARGTILRTARQRLTGLTTAQAVEALGANDVPCAPVLMLPEIADHPQVVANEVVQTVNHPTVGELRQPRPTPPLLGTLPQGFRPAPGLGQHTSEILRELDFDDDDVERLQKSRAVISQHATRTQQATQDS